MYLDYHIYWFSNMENHHSSEELGEWQQVHFSTISAKLINGDDNSSAFPPGNHEDLPICSPCDDPEPNHAPSPPADGDGVRRRKRLHLGALQILEVFGRLRNCVTCKVGLWSIAWIAGGVAAAFLVSFWRRRVRIWWQRQLQLDSSKETLLALITEKDKKMNQLLFQIAQMNEMLLARRRVPVIRVRSQTRDGTDKLDTLSSGRRHKEGVAGQLQ